jgi:hypothetical protein
VSVCVCVFLVRSHSFFSHAQKRPLVSVLRIIISFLFLHGVRSDSIGCSKKTFSLAHRGTKKEKKTGEGRRGEKRWMPYLSWIVNQQYTLVTINLLIRLIIAERKTLELNRKKSMKWAREGIRSLVIVQVIRPEVRIILQTIGWLL